MHKSAILFFFSMIAFLCAAIFGTVIAVGNFEGVFGGLIVFLVLMAAILIVAGMRLFVDAIHACIVKDLEEYE